MRRWRPSPAEVARALAEWEPQELAAEVRRGERDHRGALRFIDEDGDR